MPETMPIQWSFVSIGATTDPARLRVGSTEKSVGASTAKKITPPSQTIRDSNMRNRRKAMRKHYAGSLAWTPNAGDEKTENWELKTSLKSALECCPQFR